MADLLKFGIYILLLLPGFIWVQIRDHHLLREEKSQVQRGLEIILASTVCWTVMLLSPEWVVRWLPQITHVRTALLEAVRHPDQPLWPAAASREGGLVFLTVCGVTFFAATFWGVVRKRRIVDVTIMFLTGRDWYPSTQFRFFSEAINKPIVFKVDDKRYMGVLFAAPDQKEDQYIIVKEIILLNEQTGKPEPLPLIQSMMVNVAELESIECYTADLLKPKPLTGHSVKARIFRWLSRS